MAGSIIFLLVVGILPLGFGDEPLLPHSHVMQLAPPPTVPGDRVPPGLVESVCRRSRASAFGLQTHCDTDSQSDGEVEPPPLIFGRRVRQRTQDTLAPWHPESEIWTMVPASSSRRWTLKDD